MDGFGAFSSFSNSPQIRSAGRSSRAMARQIVALGGQPVLREGVVTDNGNCILDVHHFAITDPRALESTLDHIAGVVTNGLFSRRGADVLLVGHEIGRAHV